MSKSQDYADKAAASLAAADAATTDKERAFHRNAHAIWRKLGRGLGEAEERAAMQPAAPARAPVAKKPAAMKAVTLPRR